MFGFVLLGKLMRLCTVNNKLDSHIIYEVCGNEKR